MLRLKVLKISKFGNYLIPLTLTFFKMFILLIKCCLFVSTLFDAF